MQAAGQWSTWASLCAASCRRRRGRRIGFIEERRGDLAGLVLTNARGSHRCRALSVATPALPDLCHALHRQPGPPQAGESVWRAWHHHRVPDVGQVLGRAVRDRIDHPDPLHPGAQRLDLPNGRRHRSSHWRLEKTRSRPLVDDDYDAARLEALADEDVLAMVCDSTNALVAGETGSEGDVRKRLVEIIARCSDRVAVACFASNVARLETAMKRPKLRAPGCSGGALDATDRRGGARDGLSGRFARLPVGTGYRLPAQERDPATLYREPGRKALGPLAHRPRRTSPMRSWILPMP